VLTVGGLVWYFVLFLMRLKTRTVEIAGITRQPNEARMKQTARNLTDAQDRFFAVCATSFSTGTRSTPPPSGACSGIAP
jgi:hypothetical protein